MPIVYNNNLQSVLNTHALSQRQLADITELGLETVGKTCRRINDPKPATKALIIKGLNKLLKDRKIKKSYTVDDIFLDDTFGVKSSSWQTT